MIQIQRHRVNIGRRKAGDTEAEMGLMQLQLDNARNHAKLRCNKEGFVGSNKACQHIGFRVLDSCGLLGKFALRKTLKTNLEFIRARVCGQPRACSRIITSNKRTPL